MKIYWRMIFWIYRSAAGGWYVWVFKRGFHIPGPDWIKRRAA